MNKDDVIHNYYDNIDWEKEYRDGDIVGKCPICQTNITIHFFGIYRESSVTQCQTKDCFYITSRGL